MRLRRWLFVLLAGQGVLAAVLPLGVLAITTNVIFTDGFSASDAAAHQAQRGVMLALILVFSVLLIALLLAAWLVARRVAEPQITLLQASQTVAEGDYESEFAETGPVETVITMRNLRRIARSFERLENARRTWLVAIAEELRRPVDALTARVEEGAISDAVIDESVTRLREITADLQAVALADLGRLPVNFRTVDPRALIHNAIHANKKRAEVARILLTTGALPSVTVPVKWDGGRIEQLFTALIENSLRYTPAGGRIELGLEGRREAWELTIDDSAPGVDVGLAQRLFEPFYRSVSQPGESVTSSGLGLATAQAIVEAHHGRIEAGRSPLGGLRVAVVLPATPPTV